MLPLLASGHLNFLADLLGLSLNCIHRIHKCAAMMALAHLTFHVISLVITEPQFSLHVPANFAAILVLNSLPW